MPLLHEIKTEIQNLKSTDSGVGSDLRGLLLAATGSFTRGYHLEFALESIAAARELCDELAQHDIFAHLRDRRVYLKDCESICNLLALVGANKSLYKLNDQIAMRSVRNVSNRRANCDTANIGKSIETAAAQVEMLGALYKSAAYKTLPKDLQQTLKARLDNPSATYDELSQILGISKSGVVHRIKRLFDLPQNP